MPNRQGTKLRKPLDPEVLRKRMERAILTLKKAIIRAIRDGLVSREVGLPINGQISELDQAISSAFPVPAANYESMAKLPF